MIDLLNTKKGQLSLIIFHVLLGFAVKYSHPITSYAYVGLFALFCYDVFVTRDKDSRAGFYCLYLMGLELIYRMAGAPFSWELGKYVSILILIVGLLAGKRQYVAWIFVLLLLLLVPAVILSENPDSERLRKQILFNISGPLTLIFSGFYFYRRAINEEKFVHQLKFVFLPAFTICVALSIIANISEMEFTSLQSNARASGGFQANQVSTVLGWFILLGLLLKFNRNKLTPYQWLDWGIIFYLLLRALLTFSRGGVMGSILALVLSIVVLFFSSHLYRKRITKLLPYILLGIVLFIGVFIVANNITGGMLLYRYRGYSTSEMQAGVTSHEGSMLTGRDTIMEAEIEIFKEHPFWGVGVGMSRIYRNLEFGQNSASHTEFTRLLAEHGFFGILFMLIGMIILPLSHFFSERGMITRYFFIAFYFLSIFTMFHGAMRLALPGILFGAAFINILGPSSHRKNEKQEVKILKSN